MGQPGHRYFLNEDYYDTCKPHKSGKIQSRPHQRETFVLHYKRPHRFRSSQHGSTITSRTVSPPPVNPDPADPTLKPKKPKTKKRRKRKKRRKKKKRKLTRKKRKRKKEGSSSEVEFATNSVAKRAGQIMETSGKIEQTYLSSKNEQHREIAGKMKIVGGKMKKAKQGRRGKPGRNQRHARPHD